jgi:uncharacterized protein YkwD
MCATLATAVVACALGATAASAAHRRAVASASSAPCAGTTLVPSSADTAAVSVATLCLVNQIRSAHHLRALHANSSLLGVATSQVRTMLNWDYFSDVRPSGQTPLALVRVTRYHAHAAAMSVGQNIAWGTGSFATPAHIVAEWMASPPHRAVILTGKYRDAGVGVTPAVPGVLRKGPEGGATYAMEFGARRF